MRALEKVFQDGETTTLTFDCYGTLIDWERGAVDALRNIYGYSDELVSQEELINMFLDLDALEITRNVFPYGTVLKNVADNIAKQLLGQAYPKRSSEFAETLPDWPVFDETHDALAELATRFRLAIVSNVDDSHLARSLQQIGVPFDVIVTSQQTRSYKPDKSIFKELLRRLEENPKHIVHVAEGLCEAIPATNLGMRSVWIRRSLRSDDGSGAIPNAVAKNLSEVARASRGHILSTNTQQDSRHD